MAKFEDGEFELVLGNKQILSAFFIVVILFGVFFTMGFIVGKNAVTTTSAGEAGKAPAPASGGEQQVAGAVPPEAQSKPAAAKPSPGPVEEEQPQPAAMEVKPASAAAPPPKPEEKPQPPAAKAPVAAAPAAGDSAPAGSYVQVIAVRQEDAAGVAKGLQSNGLSAFLVQVEPGKDLYRVIVGPVNTPEEYNQTKNKLFDLGWRKVFRVKHP